MENPHAKNRTRVAFSGKTESLLHDLLASFENLLAEWQELAEKEILKPGVSSVYEVLSIISLHHNSVIIRSHGKTQPILPEKKSFLTNSTAST